MRNWPLSGGWSSEPWMRRRCWCSPVRRVSVRRRCGGMASGGHVIGASLCLCAGCMERHVNGELDVATAAKAKWWLIEQQNIVADRCLQLFGDYGYMQEYPIARIFTDSCIQKVYGGTKEIIARSL
ncbi:MAG: hypothetical protein GEU86_23085 [Actinophytocola sp.]|nr:hypothetical protein [Actinophytocola sp.]